MPLRDMAPVAVFDLDGTVLDINSFPHWVMFLIAGHLPETGLHRRLLLSLRVALRVLRECHGSTDAGSASPDATAEVNLFGTPKEVVDRIEMLREDFSTDEIMFEVNCTASVPREVVMNTMRLLTDKVIPKFK